MGKQMWKQELLWIKRNEAGVVVGIRELPPEVEDFVPTMPNPKEYPHKKIATGQGD